MQSERILTRIQEIITKTMAVIRIWVLLPLFLKIKLLFKMQQLLIYIKVINQRQQDKSTVRVIPSVATGDRNATAFILQMPQCCTSYFKTALTGFVSGMMIDKAAQTAGLEALHQQVQNYWLGHALQRRWICPQGEGSNPVECMRLPSMWSYHLILLQCSSKANVPENV